MGVINLADGSFYMIGAYMAYALILMFEECRSLLVRDDVCGVKLPDFLAGSIPLGGRMTYPVSSVYSGMGNSVLIICFVVVVIGGIGAYATVLLSPQDGPASLLGGGTDGIYLASKPVLGSLLDLNKAGAVWLSLACLMGVFGFLALLLRSRFGHALAGIRVNGQRMRATGFSTCPYKLAAFVISGGIASLAGFSFVVKDGFVNPELIAWHLSGEVLMMIILGGLGHLRGALLGAFAFALLQEFFKSEEVFGEFAKHWHLGLGLTIIASVAARRADGYAWRCQPGGRQ